MSEITERLKVAIADRYVVERELGQGGMATVYLAHDVKHDRKVALKVLRPELAAVIGAERFLQEIKVTANLQHSHILPLYDSGAAEGFLYYVMPYVEGETLRTRLDREKQLGVDVSVAMVRALAAALEHAHKQGVIHRDIKPENILLRDDDPLIADFGIALALSHAGGNRLTETGLSIGTPHYMSPEQAMGDREMDARSDIYSLGAVLYEMLTGEPPYTGGTAQAIVARVITEEPRSITLQRRTVPPHVAEAVHKALNKLPADRFSSAVSFAEALVTPGYVTPTHVRTGMHAAAGPRVPAWRRALWPAAAGLLLALALWGWLRPGEPPHVARYGLAFAPGQEPLDGYNQSFAVAPDGSWIVYDGPGESGQQLWIKERDSYEAVPLPGTQHSGPSAPIISPDGDWIVFTAGGQLRKVPRGGGSAITVADSVQVGNMSSTWLDDGTIVYRDILDRLRRVPDVGGVSEVIWPSPDGEGQVLRLPNPLPGGRGVLVGWCPQAGCVEQSVAVLDLESRELRVLVPDAVTGWYVPGDYLVYVRPDGGVFAVPFSLGSLDVTGPPVPVLEGIQVANGLVPDFALSPSGTLLMVLGPAGGSGGAAAELVWVTRDGVVTEVDPDWQVNLSGSFGWSISPDGRRLAVTSIGSASSDVWVKELDRGPVSRLTTGSGPEIRPRWTTDGRGISYIAADSGNNDLYVRRADGTQPAERVLDLDEPIWEGLWSRDGRWLVVRVGGTDRARDIWAQRLGVDSMARRLLASDFDENGVSLSPDGRWLAYQSDESGQLEVYVRPFPDIASGKWTISLGGGSHPLWAHSGRELFYVDGDNERLVAAQVRTTPTFTVVDRRPLFRLDNYMLTPTYTNFDVSADDRRFLMARPAGSGEQVTRAIVLVENWIEELRQLVRR